MNKIILFFVLVMFVNAKSINIISSFIIKTRNNINNIKVVSNRLYVATNKNIEVFDIKTKKHIFNIKTNKTKIYNVDILDNDVLFTSKAGDTYREVYLFRDLKLFKIIAVADNIYVTKALFVDKNTIIFSSLGSEVYLYDLVKNKIIYKVNMQDKLDDANSVFADMALNDSKTKVVLSDESGSLKVLNIKNKKIKVLDKQNKDKVFNVAFKNNIILAAGKDRKCGIYDIKNDKSYYLKAKFFIFATAISNNEKLGAYMYNQDNDIKIFDIKTKDIKYVLKGVDMNIGNIVFWDDKTVFVSNNSKEIYIFKLRGK